MQAVAWEKELDWATDGFRGGVAKDGFRPPIPASDDAIEILADDAVVRRFNDGRQVGGLKAMRGCRVGRIDVAAPVA